MNVTSIHGNTQTTQARRSKVAHIRQRRLIVLLAVTLLVGIIVGLGISVFANTLKMGSEVKDEDTIIWCESADPNAYFEAKQELAKLIESKTGFVPEKLVFKVGGGNYQTKLYTANVWYEIGDHWFVKDFRSWSIAAFSPELDAMLCDIYTA